MPCQETSFTSKRELDSLPRRQQPNLGSIYLVVEVYPSQVACWTSARVDEFPLVLECKVIQTIEIGSHTQFIGEILDMKAETSVLSERGAPDIEKVKPIVYSPRNRVYNAVGTYLKEAFSIGKEISG